MDYGETVKLPIDGTLDLHTFRPDEVKELLPEYFAVCLEAGLHQVRVVHGKGTGALRRAVEALLRRSPYVATFSTGDEGAGGWGATLVTLKRP
jgi:DNA-nicking Smr family endonuclease